MWYFVSGNEIMELQVFAIIAIVFLVSLCSLLFINKQFIKIQLSGGKTFDDVLFEKRQFADKLYGTSTGKNSNKKNPKKLNEKNNKKVSSVNFTYTRTFHQFFMCFNIILSSVYFSLSLSHGSLYVSSCVCVLRVYLHNYDTWFRTRIGRITIKRTWIRAPLVRTLTCRATAARAKKAMPHRRPITNCMWNLSRPRLLLPIITPSSRWLSLTFCHNKS